MDDLSSLLGAAHQSRVAYAKGRQIYGEGDASSAIFRVEEGCVRLQLDRADGHRQIVAFLFPGSIFGICMDTRDTSAEAVSDVRLTRYALDSVLDLSVQSRKVAFELIRSATAQFREVTLLLASVSLLTANERMLWFLGWLAMRLGIRNDRSIHLPMSRREIGDFLSLTPETLSRVLRELQADGSVTLEGPRTFRLAHSRPLDLAPDRPSVPHGSGARPPA